MRRYCDSTRRRALLMIGSGFLATGFALLLAYFVGFRSVSPSPSRHAPGALDLPRTTQPGLQPKTASFGGIWTVRDGSQASFRARLETPNAPVARYAVGESPVVSGIINMSESNGIVKIVKLDVDVAMRSLHSAEPRLDEVLRSAGFETEHYPIAGFLLAAPLSFPASAIRGRVATFWRRCTFGIHARLEFVMMLLKLSFQGATLRMTTSLRVPWLRYGMSPPHIAGIGFLKGDPTFAFNLQLKRNYAS